MLKVAPLLFAESPLAEPSVDPRHVLPFAVLGREKQGTRFLCLSSSAGMGSLAPPPGPLPPLPWQPSSAPSIAQEAGPDFREARSLRR